MTKMGRKRQKVKKPMKTISKQRIIQSKAERELTARLVIKQNGKCFDCGRTLGWGSAKHEIIFRSHGGSPTEESNCVLLCLECHGARHGENLICEQ